MKKIITALGLVLSLVGGVQAAGGDVQLDKAPDRSKDLGALQNGAKLFVNYCLNCHGASFVRYNRMKDLGLTDEQIKEYLTQRYGDFVLYRPPVRASTWLLWVGPFLLLLIGLYGLVRVMAARRTRPEVSLVDLDQAERDRARDLLAGSDRRGG